MFKRLNKITSLLIAVAATISMVPAYASDVKKIDSEDGTVYGAVAYKDGKVLIDREVDDTEGVYLYSDGKYTELDDIDSGSDYAPYGTKYAEVDDGDYFVDLEKGTVTDDNMDEDDEDDAASALRKEIKNSDRYTDSYESTDDDVVGDNDIANLTLIPGSKFGESWYSAKYALDVSVAAHTDSTYSTTTEAGVSVSMYDSTGTGAYYSNIYTDSKGNYIDADYNLGKIKVETTSGSATIENSIDREDLDGSKDASAKISKAKVLGQDSSYIYRYAEITITLALNPSEEVTINNRTFKTNSNGEVILPVIQKISKAQDSDEIDDAKYAKNVYNYVISDKDENSSTDVMVTGSGLSSGDEYDYYKLATDTSSDIVGATVIGGKLVLYKVNNSSDDDNVYVQAATLKSQNGYYYTDVEEQTSLGAEFNDDLDKTAFDTDVDGNIYVLENGYVKKFDGTDDFDKVYKVDGSMDSLSVYDKDNLITWSQDDEVYSIIGEKSSDDSTATTPVTTAATGWVKSTDGVWSYVNSDGTKATGWFLDNTNTWYYSNADGTMLANAWTQDSVGAWYYLSGSGAMLTNNWIQYNGAWYYLGANGAMLTNTTTPDGYYVGANGAWV